MLGFAPIASVPIAGAAESGLSIASPQSLSPDVFMDGPWIDAAPWVFLFPQTQTPLNRISPFPPAGGPSGPFPTVRSLPFLERVPEIESVGGKDRLRRASEKLSSIINSLIAKEQLCLTGVAEWEICAPGGATMGTVWSVAVAAPAAGITVTGSPITTAGTITLALADDLAGVEGLASTGLATRTAASTWTTRTITGTADKITVTDGDGVAGNPTLTIAATYAGQSSIVTVGTITTGVWDGTDVAITAGGTGANSAAGARTNLGLVIGTDVQAWDATLDAFAAYNTAGLITQTAANTFTGRTVTGTSNQITVSNGDGVSGNPTLSIATTYSGNDYALCGGRLGTENGVCLSTSDQTGKTTIYFNPGDTTFWGHNKIVVYNGSAHILYTITAISVAVPSTIFRVFDIFVYDSSGTLTLETENWNQSTGTITAATAATPCVVTSAGHGLSNGDLVGIVGIVGSLGTHATNGINNQIYQVSGVTADTFNLAGLDTTGLTYTSDGTWYKMTNTRATALTTQDGVLVKSGATTRRYLGTGVTGSTSGQLADSRAFRGLWNCYNKVPRRMLKEDSTSHSYAVGSTRVWNNNNANRVVWVQGLNSDVIPISSFGSFNPSTTAGTAIDSISYDNYETTAAQRAVSALTSTQEGDVSSYATPALGCHFMAMCEFANISTTFNRFSMTGIFWS